MLRYIPILVLSLALVSCNSRKDYFEENAMAPELKLKRNVDTTFQNITIRDTVKVNYALKYNYLIVSAKPLSLAFENSDNDIIVKDDSENHNLLVSSSTAGEKTIKVSVTDPYEHKSQGVIALSVFCTTPIG